MDTEIKDMIDSLIEKNIIAYTDIPNIDLYVDQVTSFIEQNIGNFSKDKSLTKPMINNYCKNGVIPPSDKKKYNRNHILLLILIYNTKSILQINDLKKIFESTKEEDLLEYYTSTNQLMENFNENFKTTVMEDFNQITSSNDIDKIKILATKLAIEANYKKLLSELLIEKYL